MRSIEDRAFSYVKQKDGTVVISYENRPVTTLRGKEASKFISRIDGLSEEEAQHLMARVTGNFRRGNERRR